MHTNEAPTPHRPSCAAAWRKGAEKEGWPGGRLADEIHRCCGISRLRAHRLARGWTLADAVSALRDLCTESGIAPPRLDKEALRRHETGKLHMPHAQTVALLCRLYESTMDGLGFGPRDVHLISDAAPLAPSARHLAVPDALERSLDAARRAVDRTLARGTVSSSQLDLLEERFNSLRLQYTTTAPALMLSHLLEELQEVEALANDRQPAAVQLRLSEMTAVLSTLVADALMKLGRLRQSRAWYDTARTAADDAQNADTRARVRAQAAMLPYYYGPLEDALRLTREARLLSRGQPSATSAFAAIADARALARQGNAGAARAAITAARHDFDRAQHGNPDDAFAFPYRRLLLYLSGAYTSLGMTSQAHAVQAEALKLYGDHPGIDPVLLKLEQAICLVRERSLSDACQLASAAYLRVPEDHRTRILGTRARNIIDAVPPSQRSARPVQALGEVLELPSGRS